MANSSLGDQGRKDKGNKYYLPLYKAAHEGDWKTANEFFDSDPDALTAKISPTEVTALHVASISGDTSCLKELVQLMPREALAIQNKYGMTALHSAATSGNTEAAKAMVTKNPDLPQMRNMWQEAPIHRAVSLGHKDLLWYLCSVTRDEHPSPFRGVDGAYLLTDIIAADFYDVALHLVNLYPQLATSKNFFNLSALGALGESTSAFKSRSGLGFWENCIYSSIHVEQASIINFRVSRDIENPLESSNHLTNMTQIVQELVQRLKGKIWDAIKLVPIIKQIYDTKVKHTQALELLKCICTQVSLMGTREEMADVLNDAALLAAEYGNVEVLTACFEIDAEVILTFRTDSMLNLLHLAIKYRQEKVFNLIRDLGPIINVMVAFIGGEKYTILHQAAKLGPTSKVNAVTGAALQMQRELQWYQEVEKISQPTFRKMQNLEGKTPRVIFTEEHKDLMEKGEKWMKDMASSSMIVSTLISTVVFAAAFTVPGGNDSDTGTPIFLKATWFMIFSISNALALFSSLTSVLIFLSILTSRYAEEDFLKALPQKLIIGLAMLFFSIAAMMAAFSATYFIMLRHGLSWIALFLALLASFPVSLFALLQLPLFVEVIRSTYGSDVFNRRKFKCF